MSHELEVNRLRVCIESLFLVVIPAALEKSR